MTNNLSGIILAGGKSSRMGTNKAFVLFQNRRMIDWSYEKLTPFTSSILVSSNSNIPDMDARIIPDIFPDKGPLGGLYASLLASESEWNLLIPCDVPLVPVELFKQMLPFCNSQQAVIPKLPNGNLEPLVAVYNRNIIPVLEQMILTNDFKLMNLFSKIHVHYFPVEDPSIFKNINAPSDLL